jgi:hypothetical protein
MNIKNCATFSLIETIIWERKEISVIGNIETFQVGSNSINGVFI